MGRKRGRGAGRERGESGVEDTAAAAPEATTAALPRPARPRRARTTAGSRGDADAGAGADDGHGDDTRPERCPLFPAYRTVAMGWIEAHRYVSNGRGGERTQTIDQQFDPALTDVQLARLLPAGRYLLKLKDRGGGHKTQREFGGQRLLGGDGGGGDETGGELIDAGEWEPDREWRALIRQQSDIIPAMFEAVTASLSRSSELAHEAARNYTDRMDATMKMFAATLQNHETRITGLMTAHQSQLEAVTTREGTLRAEADKLRLENAGYLKERAQAAAGGARGWIADIKALAPEIPKLEPVARRIGKALLGKGGEAGAQDGAAGEAGSRGALSAPAEPGGSSNPFGD